MTYVLVEKADGIARVTLNDPARRNALNMEMVAEIEAAFDAIEADPDMRVVIVTGAGSAFCAGADVGILLSADINLFKRVYEAFLRVRACPLPTIAAVDGPATGAGLNIVLACDLCITTPRAKLISRFLEIGLHPGGGHTWLLDQIVGPAWAKALVLFGEEMDGRDAVTAGISLRCVDPDELVTESMRLARQAARVPPELLKRAKATQNEVAAVADHAEAISIESEAQAWSATLPFLAERIEALKQRIEKRNR